MNPTRDLQRLAARLDEIDACLGWPDDRLYVRVAKLSSWSPAQHVDHILRSLGLILDRVDRLATGRDPEITAAGRPAVVGRVVLVTGWIPRGRGEAPGAALPDPRPVRHRLREGLQEARAGVSARASEGRAIRAIDGTLPHPALGRFSAAAWVRFADTHTRHHLRILRNLDRHRAVGAPRAADGPEYGVSAEAP